MKKEFDKGGTSTIWLNLMIETGAMCENDTSTAILHAALDEFALRSLEGARTREIARKAGVNHAAICYYFGGKLGIYSRIIELTVEDFKRRYKIYMKEAGEIIRSENPSRERARELLFFMLAMRIKLSVAIPESKKMFLIICREELYPTALFEKIWDGIIKPMHDAVSGLVNVAMGGKLSQAEADMRAQMVFGLIIPFIYRGNFSNDVEIITEERLSEFEKILKDSLDAMLG